MTAIQLCRCSKCKNESRRLTPDLERIHLKCHQAIARTNLICEINMLFHFALVSRILPSLISVDCFSRKRNLNIFVNFDWTTSLNTSAKKPFAPPYGRHYLYLLPANSTIVSMKMVLERRHVYQHGQPLVPGTFEYPFPIRARTGRRPQVSCPKNEKQWTPCRTGLHSKKLTASPKRVLVGSIRQKDSELDFPESKAAESSVGCGTDWNVHLNHFRFFSLLAIKYAQKFSSALHCGFVTG